MMRSAVRLVRAYATQSGSVKPPSSKPPPASSASFSPKADVPGLSSNCVVTPAGGKPFKQNGTGIEVGPGASKAGNYKNPEFFCYNNTSYFEAEVEMLKFRCPQPSPFKK